MKIVVSQYWTKNIKYSSFTKMINEKFCSENGYVYHYEDDDNLIIDSINNRAFTWYKPKFIQKVIDLHDPDYVLFLDADAILVNQNYKVTDFIDSNYSCIVTEDHGPSVMNAGVLLFKNNEWTKNFLKRWWEISDEVGGPNGEPIGYYNNGLWHDQTCFGLLYNENKHEIKIIENTILNSRVYNKNVFVFHAFSYGLLKNRTLDTIYYSLMGIEPVVQDDIISIIDRYHTDKHYEHDYFNLVYNTLFLPYKNTINKFIEIGVYNGESIRLWHDYFKNATIIGLDKDPESLLNEKLNNERIELINLDQSKLEDLLRVTNNYCDVDVILDDGSHKMCDQQYTFSKLFKILKPNGIYIIEDLHTSLELRIPEKSWCNWGDVDKISTLELLEDFKKTGKISTDYISVEDSKYLEDNIVSVEIYRSKPNWSITSVIRKK